MEDGRARALAGMRDAWARQGAEDDARERARNSRMPMDTRQRRDGAAGMRRPLGGRAARATPPPRRPSSEVTQYDAYGTSSRAGAGIWPVFEQSESNRDPIPGVSDPYGR